MCAQKDGSSDLQTALRNRCAEVVVTESLTSGCLTIAGFLSGLIVCLAIYRNARLRYTIHMYILSYAVIDLVRSLFVMPFTLGVLIKGEWISSTSACQFQGYAISVLGILTLLTMTLTAIDRYVASTRLAQYLTYFKRKYVCVALAVCWLVSFAVPLSFTLDGNNFVLHPGYSVCREEIKNESYLRASILKIIVVVLPLVAIATCYCRASANLQKTFKNAKRWAQEGRMVNINSWKEEDSKTRLFAALILGTFLFCVPSYVCDIADAFTHEQCLPRSVYLLSTLFVNASCCVKPLIIANMDEDFAAEFKRILKLRKSRKVIDINVEGRKLEEDPQFMPETRKYYAKMEEEDSNNKTEESTV
ncbi:hypothetical protein ACROYT_G018331 [Oculina patagonica]